MFRRSTTFVIGAGCSKELGLPLGLGLMNEIHKTMRDASSPAYRALLGAFLRSGIPNANMDVDERFRAFSAGLSAAPSIDQYLDFHRDDEAMVMLGKCAIAAEILYSESRSKLAEAEDTDALPLCWLQNLFHSMAIGTTKQNPKDLFKNLNFICFNYDRTIELFFLRAVMFLTHCSYEEARQVIKCLNIWHPYGVVGGYKIASPGISRSSISFSDRKIDENDVLSAARGLQTFTEGMSDDNERDLIRSKLATAEQVVFLGFSYLDQNMELLQLRPSPTRANAIYGTVFGMSPTDADLAKRAIARCVGGDGGFQKALRCTQIFDLQASDMLDRMGKTLRS